MKVSIDWLKQLVKIDKPIKDLIQEINMKTIGTKEVTSKFIELDMKGYNRADLLSLRGVAYEAAALLETEVKFKEAEEKDFVWKGKNLPKTRVEIKEKELAQIQCVAKIEGLKVKPSSEDWINKIKDSGMRPVNNIADITNLIMLEYGQPLHAFDASTVKDDAIIVRRAKDGEEIMTLDNKVRKLSKDDIVLADDEKALDVAGVMGGKDTEITEKTQTILLSASFFNPEFVRKTGNKLKLQSEASKRFYHGLTKKRLLQSLDAAIRMFESIGGKLTAINLVGDFEDEKKAIKLRVEKNNSLIGLDLTPEEIKGLLARLNFKVKEIKPRVFEVTKPYFRLDVSIEEDLIEEVARMYGYDKIPSKELPGELPKKQDQRLFEFIDLLKKQLMHQGLSEIRTYSFYTTNTLNALGFDEEKQKYLIKLANPISKETQYLRMNLWPNLVEAAVLNNKNFKDVAIFEIGKTYAPSPKGVSEKYTLAIALVNDGDNPTVELIKILNQVFKNLNLQTSFKDSKILGEAKRLFHPLRFKSIVYKGNQIGGIAQVHPEVLDKYNSKNTISVAEIDLEKLV